MSPFFAKRAEARSSRWPYSAFLAKLGRFGRLVCPWRDDPASNRNRVTNARPRILALFGAGSIHGQERANLEVLCTLREQGCEVLCLVRDEKWAAPLLSTLDAVGMAWRKAAYIEQRLPGRIMWFILRNPIAFVRGNCQMLLTAWRFRPSHIHAFNQLYVLNFLPALALLEAPMVFRAGDKPTCHNWVWRLVWRLVVRRTSRFVANSRYVADELIKSGVAPEQIRLVYSRPARRGAVPPFRPPGNCAADEIRFVYVGQINADKGTDVLIEAFARLKGPQKARLLIAGRISDWRGDDWARALRDRVLADANLRQRVDFLGYVEDILGLLEYCHVHVCPSVWEEPLANVVLEAKGAGRPSIVFPSGGLPEVVTHRVDGYICAERTVDALAAVLQTYLVEPSLFQTQGSSARQSLDRIATADFAQAWTAAYECCG